jgi:transglutaminase-like putative cysteine protease
MNRDYATAVERRPVSCVEVEIEDVRESSAAAGLLVPVPPNTGLQSTISVELPSGWRSRLVRSDDGAQQAYFVEELSDSRAAVTYNLQLSETTPVTPFISSRRTPTLPKAVSRRITQVLTAATTPREKEQAIIRFALEHFRYGDRARVDVGEQLSCSVATGNCLDINGFLIDAFALAGVPCCYYAGYFFPDAGPDVSDGMHCWLCTSVNDDHHYWDVPYTLKAGKAALYEGLGPIPGTYVSMSAGHGIRFALGLGNVELPFLACPVWIHQDCSAVTASTTARLLSRSSSRPGAGRASAKETGTCDP